MIWMKNTPTHPELAGWLAGWLAVAFQQKSYWGHKDCINLSLALSFVVFVVVVVCLLMFPLLSSSTTSV
jgi:glycopeptide antibiotics resistance protein